MTRLIIVRITAQVIYKPIAVMGSVMGFLYYCYGPHYGNGSSTYRTANQPKSQFLFHKNCSPRDFGYLYQSLTELIKKLVLESDPALWMRSKK